MGAMSRDGIVLVPERHARCRADAHQPGHLAVRCALRHSDFGDSGQLRQQWPRQRKQMPHGYSPNARKASPGTPAPRSASRFPRSRVRGLNHLANAAPTCPKCHDKLTNHGYRLERRNGTTYTYAPDGQLIHQRTNRWQE